MRERSSESPLSVELAVDWALTTEDDRVSPHHAEDLMRHALVQECQTGSWHFAIRFVNDLEMAQLHETWLGDLSPTDILTFAYDPEDGAQGGDIVISLDTAARNATDAGWRLSDELHFLMLHGLLHVLGWDDHSATYRAAMLERQQELLASWKPREDIE